MRIGRLLCGLGVGVAALLGVTPAAGAVVQVAAPGGTGMACSETTPCALSTAISAAGSGGEVLAKPGIYTMGNGTVALNVNLHGTPGPTRPTFAFPNMPNAYFQMNGGSLTDLDVIGGGTRAVLVAGSLNTRLERVALRCTVCTGATLNVQNPGATATVRDSLLTSAAGTAGALGLFSGSATMSGVTAINTSTGPGVALTPGSGVSAQLTVRNSIIDGQTDLSARPFGPTSSASVNIANSRYVSTDTTNAAGGAPAGTVDDAGGNTPATPLFVGAPDFHPLATSPMLNLGGTAAFDDPAAPGVDLDGVPRWFGPKPDLGAYELPVPPALDTMSATDVTTSSAKFVAVVSPNVVAASTLRFEYGLSTAYGQTATVGMPSGGITPTTQAAAVSGLTPATTYHVRAVLVAPGGTAVSEDRTFTTAGGPVDPGPGPGPGPGPSPNPNPNPAPDRTAPKLEGVKPAPSSVKRGKSTAVTFKLTEAGKVTIRVQAILPGRLKGKTCVAPTKKLRKAKGCSRYVTKLTLTPNGIAGSNKVSLSTSKLARGKYRILVRATDAAGNVSRESATTLKIS